MKKYRKNQQDVEYYVPGKKRRVTGSTVATSDFLAAVHRENPGATISQLREIITDQSRYIICPEAVAALDAHIKAGYSDYIPDWE